MPDGKAASASLARFKKLNEEFARLQAETKKLTDAVRDVLATMEERSERRRSAQKRPKLRRK